MPVQQGSTILVDACVSRRVVEGLRELGIECIYICEIDSSMPDNEVKSIGHALDCYIATANVKHFLDYDKVIPLPSKKNAKHLIKEINKYIL